MVQQILHITVNLNETDDGQDTQQIHDFDLTSIDRVFVKGELQEAFNYAIDVLDEQGYDTSNAFVDDIGYSDNTDHYRASESQGH